MERETARRGRGASAEELTPRLREWLRHLQACTRGGETIRAYARRHHLSDQGMYQAAKVLRRREVWPPRREAAPVSFARVERVVAASPARPDPVWRVRTPRGVVFETTAPIHGDLLVTVLDVLERS